MKAWKKGAVIGGLLGLLFTLSFIYVVFGALIGAFLSRNKGLLYGLIWGGISIPVVILSRFSYFFESTREPPLILKILFLPGYISEYLGHSSDLNIVISTS